MSSARSSSSASALQRSVHAQVLPAQEAREHGRPLLLPLLVAAAQAQRHAERHQLQLQRRCAHPCAPQV